MLLVVLSICAPLANAKAGVPHKGNQSVFQDSAALGSGDFVQICLALTVANGCLAIQAHYPSITTTMYSSNPTTCRIPELAATGSGAEGQPVSGPLNQVIEAQNAGDWTALSEQDVEIKMRNNNGMARRLSDDGMPQ